MKQENLFGNAVELTITQNKKRGRKTLKQAFREVAGYDDRHTCADCKYHYSYERCKRRFHKCRTIGNNGCESTDIRLSDKSCKFWSRRK